MLLHLDNQHVADIPEPFFVSDDHFALITVDLLNLIGVFWLTTQHAGITTGNGNFRELALVCLSKVRLVDSREVHLFLLHETTLQESAFLQLLGGAEGELNGIVGILLL